MTCPPEATLEGEGGQICEAELDKIEGHEQIYRVDLRQVLALQLCDLREVIQLLCVLGPKETQRDTQYLQHKWLCGLSIIWMTADTAGNLTLASSVCWVPFLPCISGLV